MRFRDKIKKELEENEILITSYEQVIRIYETLKTCGYKEKDDTPDVEFIENMKFYFSNDRTTDYELFYILHNKVVIYYYKISTEKMIFNMNSKRIEKTRQDKIYNILNEQ